MRKFLILLMCSLSLLGIDTAVASSDKPAKKVILTNVPNGEVKLSRDIIAEPLQCYFSSESLLFVALQDFGEIDIKVENLLTNELFCGEFNPMGEQQYVLYIGEEAGTYEITCTTLSGCVYSGMLTI